MPVLRDSVPTRPSDQPRKNQMPSQGWETPIFDGQNRLIGWTNQPPEFRGGVLIHPAAEQIVGSKVVCKYVEIDDPSDAMRAGAPPDWPDKWRCLAFCAEKLVTPK